MSSNPWEQLFKQTLGSAILITAGDAQAQKEYILAEADRRGITLGNIVEKYVDEQLASASFPPMLGVFRTQIIQAVNRALDSWLKEIPDKTEALFQLILGWAGEQATKLGA